MASRAHIILKKGRGNLPIELKVPKDFRDKKELKHIIMAANLLNAELEKVPVFRSHACKKRMLIVVKIEGLWET